MNDNITNTDKFWTQDITILYKNHKYLEIIPTSQMTKIEQLNAITRFLIYFIIIALVLTQSNAWIRIPFIILIIIIILYNICKDDLEKFVNDMKEKNKENNSVIESGYYDSDGYLRFTNNNPPPKINEVFTRNEYEQYNKSTCRKPTPDNPFMNPTLNDFNIKYPPEACNVDDDEIKEQIDNTFYDKLFMDVGDLFSNENSQRQFYTIPHQNPPDQTAFAKWLYNTDNICKVNQANCLKYEDLRYKRLDMN